MPAQRPSRRRPRRRPRATFEQSSTRRVSVPADPIRSFAATFWPKEDAAGRTRQKPYFPDCCDARALRCPGDFVLILRFRTLAIGPGPWVRGAAGRNVNRRRGPRDGCEATEEAEGP